MNPSNSSTAAMLIERFGGKFLLSTDDIAQIIGTTPAGVHSRAHRLREGLPIELLPPMRREGQRLVAHILDVAAWLDSRPKMEVAPPTPRAPKPPMINRGRPSQGAKRKKKHRKVSAHILPPEGEEVQS